jgi:hypothetical protein
MVASESFTAVLKSAWSPSRYVYVNMLVHRAAGAEIRFVPKNDRVVTCVCFVLLLRQIAFKLLGTT